MIYVYSILPSNRWISNIFCWWTSASRIFMCIRYVYTLKKMLKKQEQRICWNKKKNNGSAFALGRGAPQMWIRNQTLMNLIFNEIAIISIEFPFYPTQKYLGEQCWRYKRILLNYWDAVISVTPFSCDFNIRYFNGTVVKKKNVTMFYFSLCVSC